MRCSADAICVRLRASDEAHENASRENDRSGRMNLPYDLWQPVIGLEIHVELNTKSKLFSSAPNRFGDEPNTNITDVCTGQPGSLPVLNKEAVHKAVLFGCAVGAHIAHYSRFDRKSYFYPDSPRNF